MRGRVLGTLTAAAFLGMPAGVLVAGYAIEGVNPRGTLLAVGGLYLLTTLSLLINPAIRRIERSSLPPQI